MNALLTIIGWLAIGILPAGWYYADITHGVSRPGYSDFFLSILLGLIGPLGLFIITVGRLLSGKAYGWKLPKYTERETKINWFKCPEKKDTPKIGF